MIGIKGEPRVKRLAETLVDAGLFDRAEGGYRVHDYHDFNDTRQEALARKDTDREQRRQAGIASGVARRGRNETASLPLNGAVERGR